MIIKRTKSGTVVNARTGEVLSFEVRENGLYLDGRKVSSFFDPGSAAVKSDFKVSEGWKTLLVSKWRHRLVEILDSADRQMKTCTAVSVMLAG